MNQSPRSIALALLVALLAAPASLGQDSGALTLLIEISEPDGSPAPGVLVQVFKHRYRTHAWPFQGLWVFSGPVLAQAMTDDEGRVHLPVNAAQRHDVLGQRGAQAAMGWAVSIPSGKERHQQPYRLTLGTGSPLTLALTDDRDRPVAQASTFLVNPLSTPPLPRSCVTSWRERALDEYLSDETGLVRIFVPDNGPAERIEVIWVAVSRIGGEPIVAAVPVKARDKPYPISMGATTALQLRLHSAGQEDREATVLLGPARSWFPRTMPSEFDSSIPWVAILVREASVWQGWVTTRSEVTVICAPGRQLSARIHAHESESRSQMINVPRDREASVTCEVAPPFPRLEFRIVDDEGHWQPHDRFQFGFRKYGAIEPLWTWARQDPESGRIIFSVGSSKASSLIVADANMDFAPGQALRKPLAEVPLDGLQPGRTLDLGDIQVSATPGVLRSPTSGSVRADDLPFVVERKATIKGRLGGELRDLAAHCLLRVSSPRLSFSVKARLQADGRFHARNIPTGPAELIVRLSDKVMLRVPFEVATAGTLEPPALQDIAIGEALRLVTIKVVGPNDEAVPNAYLRIEESGLMQSGVLLAPRALISAPIDAAKRPSSCA